MTLASWVARYFAPLWAAERAADVALTWSILSLGGVEYNPVAAWFVATYGLARGLAYFFAFSVGVGIAAAASVALLLSCRPCMTRIDRSIIDAVGGPEAYGKAVLTAALIVGAAPIAFNMLSLAAILSYYNHLS